ncbi:flagellar basal-body rod protein FlgG [Desulfitispora alkaliphila]|uniref:flagellar hook-basal body protein n=1 Tax=Desulfitispora alkaliphila TaxID=622674 RepID=UPI003D21B51A
MIRGLYTSGHGMKVQGKMHDINANNLANADTDGFRKDIGIKQSFPEVLLYRMEDAGDKRNNPSMLPPRVGTISTGVLLEEVVTTHNTPGVLKETGRRLDAALTGPGYFTVNVDPELAIEGERYTRQGRFQVDGEGRLVNGQGHPVIGENGEIFVDGADVTIGGAGEVAVDGVVVDRLRIVNFNPDDVEKAGNTHFLHQNPEQVELVDEPSVKWGFLEGSNVDPVSEMVNMIKGIRNYEANQKAVQAHDETLDKAVNDLGRV